MNDYLHVSVAEDRLGLKYPGFSVVFMPASLEDMPEMADLFFSHITAHKEYISHGELQMVIAHLVPAEEKTAPSVSQIASDAREKWMAYLQ